MKRIALRVALVLAFAAGHTAAQQASYNFDLDTDFSKFLTYKWVDVKSEQQVDHLTAQQITIVIDAELAKKGLFKTDSDYADLYIGYQTALSRQTPWMAYRDGWGYGPRWGGGLASIAESSVRAGHLDLDIYATAEKKLVWRGAVSNAFDLGLSLGNSETKIQKSAEKLLQNYPPNLAAPTSGRQRELNDHRHSARCFLCRIAPPSALFRFRAAKNR